MSFSYTVKDELAKKVGKARHCQLAELAAILSSSGYTKRRYIWLKTDKKPVADKFCLLLKESFHYIPEVSVRANQYIVAVTNDQMAEKIKQAIKMQDFHALVEDILLQSSCCKRAFLRGNFMCNGSVSNPEKSYHLEFVFSSEERAKQVVELLATFEIEAKIAMRKHSHVVYIKEGRQIVDILNIIEAPVSLMNYENSRIRREIKGKINRQVNCDTANISKTISAAWGQINDIKLISETKGLESLSKELQQTAKLRLENPEMPLKELGELMDPPVGKSGVNHRLRKLKIIANHIRTDEEEE
jgi:hypothetical protein